MLARARLRPKLVPVVQVEEVFPTADDPAVLDLEDNAAACVEPLALAFRAVVMDPEAPRPRSIIKTRAIVRPTIFNAFQIDRRDAKWRTASERRRPPGRNLPAEVPRPSPLGWTLPTRRTATDELLQLLDQCLDALERTRLVTRHPDLLKALSAPWVS